MAFKEGDVGDGMVCKTKSRHGVSGAWCLEWKEEDESLRKLWRWWGNV